jgi:hypothetical protein
MATLYHYRESGLRNVWLANGFRLSKSPYGETVAFENVDGNVKIRDMIETLSETDAGDAIKLTAKKTRRGWKAEAA